MNSPRHCPSTSMWTCYIVTAYQTPTSLFIAGAILKIDIATICLAIYVPRVVRYLLIQRMFLFRYNQTLT